VGSLSNSGVGQLSSADAWARLSSNPSAMLVDVRTRAEWAFVGVPDISSLGRQCVFAEWQSFPDNRIDPAFPDRVTSALVAVGADHDTEVLFICRSGGRSQLAAETMASAGYTRCRNVSDGFEGPLDGNRRRGLMAGWKSAGLPWLQG
jgi:rhodanese-related sulfurtransferase